MPQKFYKMKWVLPVIILLLLPLYYFYIFYRDYRLKGNYIITEGLVTEFNFVPRGIPLQVKYTFTLSDRMFHNESILNLNRDKRELWACLLMNKNFPVIYESGNPDNSQMMLTLSDYRKYGVNIPSGFLEYASYLDAASNKKYLKVLPDTSCYKELYLAP